MRISDRSSDVCSSDLETLASGARRHSRRGVPGAFGVKFDQAVHVRTLGYFNIPFNGVLRRFGILKYPKEATSDILMSEGSAPGRAVSRCDLSIITPGVIESLTACATSPRMRSHGSRLRRPRPSKVGVGTGVYGRFRGQIGRANV